ncbi:hypothetical protein S40293_01031, partial [Stachybotrys chartarum IBT 40293]
LKSPRKGGQPRQSSTCNLSPSYSIDDRTNESIVEAVMSFLRDDEGFEVHKSLAESCQELLDMITQDSSETPFKRPEPEDYSRIPKELFPVIHEYSKCKSCDQAEAAHGTGQWHPTRLFLTTAKSNNDGIVKFDLLTSSEVFSSWQDICISMSDRRVTIDTPEERIRESTKELITVSTERLESFCRIVQEDYGFRVYLTLQQNSFFRAPGPNHDSSFEHPVMEGSGLTLARVLDQYELNMSEKISLAYSVALAYWQFYDTELMHRAWTSCKIWFMPHSDPLSDQTRLPLKAYIALHPDMTKCEEVALDFAAAPLIHKSPRIQALAILLLEIGLAESIPWAAKDNWVKSQNLLWIKARKGHLPKLKRSKWDSSICKDVFIRVVDKCLNFDKLTGQTTNSASEEGHIIRRRTLFEEVIAPLEKLDRQFSQHAKRRAPRYLCSKQPLQPAFTSRFSASNTEPLCTNIETPTNDRKGLNQLEDERPIPRRHDFGIVIICALRIEANAVLCAFDHLWNERVAGISGDINSYSAGIIGSHNVILIHMDGPGKVNAATVATDCSRSFPNVELALLVGVCGVVPIAHESKEEIILGDIVLSDGIVQYDFGRRHPRGFVPTDRSIDAPGRKRKRIRGFINQLSSRTWRTVLEKQTNCHLLQIQKELGPMADYPGVTEDRLFDAMYEHRDMGRTCKDAGCQGTHIRRLRHSKGLLQPAIHFGSIASGDTVMRCGKHRDEVARPRNILGFEMEGAGIWDSMPCVVIKGACDYADSHKTKEWQPYAAATAAACMKACLGHWQPRCED